MDDWISVDKSLPPDGIEVIVTTDCGVYTAKHKSTWYAPYDIPDEKFTVDVHAWMPMPKAYKGIGEEYDEAT